MGGQFYTQFSDSEGKDIEKTLDHQNYLSIYFYENIGCCWKGGSFNDVLKK